MKDLIEEAETWDLEPKHASLWWTSTDAGEKMDDMTTTTRTGLHKSPVREEVQDSGTHLESGHEDAGQLGCDDVERKPGLVERCEDLQKQRRTVERKIQKNCLQCFLLRERKLVLELGDPGQN